MKEVENFILTATPAGPGKKIIFVRKGIIFEDEYLLIRKYILLRKSNGDATLVEHDQQVVDRNDWILNIGPEGSWMMQTITTTDLDDDID